MKIHPSLNLYGQLNIDELLDIFKSRLKELPDSFSESDLTADFKELVFTILVKICDLSLLDIAPDDLLDLSQSNLLEVFAFLLENLSLFDEALNKEKEKARSSSQEEDEEPQALGQKEEPSSSNSKEREQCYNLLNITRSSRADKETTQTIHIR